MEIKKINLYLFYQICKNFLLILFIFLSVAWLLQISRLFTITNFMHIQIYDVIALSFYLIPNIITVISPFIVIFGLLFCFVKLNRDNELTAILSLGMGLSPFKKTLFFIGVIIFFFFNILNLYIAPKIYESYKINEHNLRNTINFNNMSFSNFINLNNSTVLDFNKLNNEYIDIFLSFKDEKENIVYAKKGKIYNEDNKYNFKLTEGFKISIDEHENIEKLEFQNYLLKVDNKNIKINNIIDKNTFTIFDDIKSKNLLNITFKIMDLIIIFFVLYLFYYNNLKKIDFSTKNNIYFCFLSIHILIINQILKNSEINLFQYILIITIIIFSSFIISNIKNKYEKN